MTTIWKELRFEAAHRLPFVPDGHKCGRLHGHSYRFQVHVSGVPDVSTGWIIDFGDIASVVSPIVALLDHRYLNEIPGLENPTSENLAKWLYEKLSPNLSGLSAVVVMETCTSGCRYAGG